LKSLSRYCTEYSHVRYEPVRDSWKSVKPCSRQILVTMSGTVMFWKMREFALRVSSQSQGLSVSWYWARSSWVSSCEKLVT
jgi:hypothetical protein